MTQTTYASFTDPEMAKKAVGALLDHGVKSEHISIIFPEGYETFTKAHETGTDLEKSAESGLTTTTGADAAEGATKGASMGLIAGTLAALACVFIPGVGIVLGGGALALALGAAAGSTAAGAVAGGVTGYLKDQGMSEDAVETYATVLQSGGALLTVFPSEESISASEVESVLAKYDGHLSLTALRGPTLI